MRSDVSVRLFFLKSSALRIFQRFIYFITFHQNNLLYYSKYETYNTTPPQQTLELFPTAFYDNEFGTVGIPVEVASSNKKNVIEITTFRSEKGYQDKRHPTEISWGSSIEEDLLRRDFTFNAIAMKIIQNKSSYTTQIIDPFHGIEDLKKNLIKAVGDPNERFKEDALRLIRAIRFATTYSFTVEDNTWKSIIVDAHLLPHISSERIRDELFKILSSDHPYEGIMLLQKAHLLEYILPELLTGIDVSQVRPGRHHTTDVFTHNVLSLKFCPSNDPIVRFATLLHDIGKPQAASVDEKGYIIFHNHEIVGAKMAQKIADRLRSSKKDKEKIVTLIRWHMFTVDEKITDAAIRRFIRRIGVSNVQDMMDLRVGDRLGGGTQLAESWRLKLFRKRIEDQLKPAPFSINDLVIDGNDIMHELQIKPGPKIGKILHILFEEVDEDLTKNNKEYLIKRLKDLA